MLNDMAPTTRLTVLVLAWTAAGLAVADEAADERASAYACDGETLVAQRRCYLEGELLPSADAAAQARQNALQAALLASRACAVAARVNGGTDAELKAACEREFQAAAQESCTLDGATPLFDEKGRFSPRARDCYDALGRVMRRTRTMSATTVACCRCLAKRCSAAPAASCHRDLFEGDAPAEAKACFAKNICASECPLAAPPDGDAAAPARAEKTSGPLGGWY